jgi:hypothetical protein
VIAGGAAAALDHKALRGAETILLVEDEERVRHLGVSMTCSRRRLPGDVAKRTCANAETERRGR